MSKTIFWFGTPGIPETVLNKIVRVNIIVEKQFFESKNNLSLPDSGTMISGVLLDIPTTEARLYRHAILTEFLLMLVYYKKISRKKIAKLSNEGFITFRSFNEENYRQLWNKEYKESFHPIFPHKIFYTSKYRDFLKKAKKEKMRQENQMIQKAFINQQKH